MIETPGSFVSWARISTIRRQGLSETPTRKRTCYGNQKRPPAGPLPKELSSLASQIINSIIWKMDGKLRFLVGLLLYYFGTFYKYM